MEKDGDRVEVGFTRDGAEGWKRGTLLIAASAAVLSAPAWKGALEVRGRKVGFRVGQNGCRSSCTTLPALAVALRWGSERWGSERWGSDLSSSGSATWATLKGCALLNDPTLSGSMLLNDPALKDSLHSFNGSTSLKDPAGLGGPLDGEAPLQEASEGIPSSCMLPLSSAPHLA